MLSSLLGREHHLQKVLLDSCRSLSRSSLLCTSSSLCSCSRCSCSLLALGLHCLKLRAQGGHLLVEDCLQEKRGDEAQQVKIFITL